MIRTAIALAAALAVAGAAQAQTTPPAKPGTTPAPDKPAATAPTKPDAKTEKAAPKDKKAASVNRVTYACDGGVSLVVRYPAEAQAKTKAVKVTVKDTTYNVRPAKSGAQGAYENTSIKLVFQTKGDEATLERDGKPLAEKCKAAKPGT